MPKALTSSCISRASICPASVALPAVYQIGETRRLKKGNAIHKFLEVALKEGIQEGLTAVQEMMKEDPRIPKWVWFACSQLALDDVIMMQDIREGHVEIIAEAAYAFNVKTKEGRFLGEAIGRDYTSTDDEIPGTADLVIRRPGAPPLVVEYKTFDDGVEAKDHEQLGWACLAVATTYDAAVVDGSLCRIDQEGNATWSHHVFTEEDFRKIAHRLWKVVERVQKARQMVAAGQTPDLAAGEHCRWCPSLRVCPAYVTLARELHGADLATKSISELTPERLGEVYSALQRYEALMQALKDAVRMAITQNGVVPLPDGKEVYVLEMRRETILLDDALPVIEDQFGPEVAQQVVKKSIDKSSINHALGKTLGEKVIDTLRGSGVIRSTPIQQLRQRKADSGKRRTKKS